MLSKFLLGENFFMKIAAINQNLLFSHFNSTNDIVLHRAKDIMFKTFLETRPIFPLPQFQRFSALQ